MCGTSMSRSRNQALRHHSLHTPEKCMEGLQSAPTDLLSSVSYGLSLPHSLPVPNGPNGLEVVADHLQITLSLKFDG